MRFTWLAIRIIMMMIMIMIVMNLERNRSRRLLVLTPCVVLLHVCKYWFWLNDMQCFIQGLKHDVPCIARSEARRGDDDQSVHETLRASRTDVPEWPLSTSCLNPIMTWIIFFHNLKSRNLQAMFHSGRWRIVHCRKYMHGFSGRVHSNAFVTSYWFRCH